MDEDTSRLPPAPSLLRIGLALFVLAWILGPHALRSAVPIWLVFVIALGLEVNFLVGALRATPATRPDRRPQSVDRDRYGYEGESDDLVLVHDGDEELWLPYAGESEEELQELIAAAREDPEEREWAPAGSDEPRSVLPAVRRFLVGLGVIACLALAIWFVESRTGWGALAGDTRAEAAARFSQEASRIAGKPVSIRCDESRHYVGSVQHADGVAYVGGDRAYLTPERCFDLYRLAFEDEVTFSQTARAIAVLAHEAWHLRGVRDEGTTECYALQSGVGLGLRLGLSESTARQMMRLQLTENALRGAGTLEYVVTRECRDGGRLDLDAGSERFP